MEKPIKYLVEEVFKKARHESGNSSVNGCCNFLETTFRDDLKCNDGTSYRSFARLHSKYITGKHPENPVPKPRLLDAMSQYLGYKDYRDFLIHYSEEEEVETADPPLPSKKSSTTRNPERIIIIVLGFLICGMLFYNIIVDKGTTPECMIWQHTHFEKISCELSLHIEKAGEIIGFDSKLFKHMKMIPKNEVRVGRSYYYKVGKDSLEFFSWYGKHPVHGADLKPVTEYIFEKYVN